MTLLFINFSTITFYVLFPTTVAVISAHTYFFLSFVAFSWTGILLCLHSKPSYHFRSSIAPSVLLQTNLPAEIGYLTMISLPHLNSYLVFGNWNGTLGPHDGIR